MRSVHLFILAGLVAASLAVPASAQTDAGAEGATIEEISLESLLDMEVSTAAKHEQTAREAPASVSVITAEDIARFGYRTLAEALASVRGFYLGNDLERTYLGARGFGRPGDYNNRVLILLDGHTLNEGSTGWASIDTQLGLDMATVERIEVVRGPGSALYGTGAMFAVVNVVTKEAPAMEGSRASVTVGSYGEQRGAASYAAALENGLEMAVTGVWGRSSGADLYFEELDSPATNHGVAEGRDWETYYGTALTASRGAIAVRGRYAAYHGGSPAAPGGRAFNSEHARFGPQQGFLELDYERPLTAGKRLTLRGYVDHAELRNTYPHSQPDGKEELLVSDRGISNGLGAEVGFQWDTSPRNRLTVGVEHRTTHLAHRLWRADVLAIDTEYLYRVTSAYVQDEYRITRDLAATLGLRHDEYSTVGSATTPRAALVYHPSRSGSLKLLYGQAFRAPSVFELIQSSPKSPRIVPNPGLGPERVHTVEAAWEQELARGLSSTLSLYNFWASDLINLAPNPAAGALQNQNVGRSAARGIELGLSARAPSGRHGYVRYAFGRACATSPERAPLSDSPEHVLKAGAVFPILGLLYAAPEVRYETRRLTARGSHTAPFLLTHLTLSTTPLFNRLDLSLSVRNALNARYELPAGITHRQRAIPQYGRTLSFSAAYRL